MEPLDPQPASGPVASPTLPGQVATSGPANPEFARAPTASTPGHHERSVEHPKVVPMAVFRLLAAVSFAGVFVLTGVQVYRVFDEQSRSLTLSWGSLVIGLVCIAAILAWTYATVENARRILAPAGTQELPEPRRAVALWVVPVAFIAPAVAVVTALSRRWNTPADGTSSSVPLLVAFGAVLVALLLLYAPLAYLAGVVRKVGGQGGSLLKWAWVPVVLAAVGAAVIVGLRAFGTFEEQYDAVAPSWVLAVLLLLPIVVVFVVGHGAGCEVESAIQRGFDRRTGRRQSGGGRFTGLPSVFGGDRPNRAVMSNRGPIKLIFGAEPLRLVVVTMLAGIALLSLVGAIVMFLFWRESNDGLLLPSQRDRAWDVLTQLQRAERYVAFALVVVVMLWAFVNVYNARLASGRRRNPIIAAVSWPVACAGIWAIGARVTDASEPEVVVGGFLVQAAIAYLPFFLLERAATAVGARRSPIRIVYALGVVLLVYVNGLGGLATIERVVENDEFGRIAGYLALGAFILLLSTLAVTEASQTISNATEHEAQHHNFLLEQRQPARRAAEPQPVGGRAPAP